MSDNDIFTSRTARTEHSFGLGRIIDYFPKTILTMALHSRLFVRIMSRNRDVYFLKILTLSIAFASSVLITLFSIHEFTYDLFHKNPERVFRVLQKNTDEPYHGNRLTAKIPSAVAHQLKVDHKDALHIARVKIMNKVTVLFQDKPFMDQKIHAVDTSIKQIFSFKIVNGEIGPNSSSTETTVWLSSRAAIKFTNTIDAVGKHLKLFTFNDTVEARIAAVFKDLPENTHEDFDILVNFDSATIAALNFNPEETGVYGRILKGEPENYNVPSDSKFSYLLQPLPEIHFGPRVLHEEARHGDLYSIIILICIASIILFLALSSFVNLTTITLPYRSKELAVKKLGGVGQVRLFLGFLRESGALVGIALLIGVLILAFSSNYLASILDVNILTLFRMFDIKLFVTIGILFVILTVSPALMTIKFVKATPTRLLSTDTITFPKFKRIITVFQLGISIFLIVASVVVRRQINYSLVKEPGANHDQIVYLHSPTGLTNEGIASMRTNWKIFNPNIVDVMAVSQLPDRLSSKEVGSEFYSLLVDPGYLDFFDYKLRKGNWFKANDGDSIIVTNAKGLEIMQSDARVIGVIQDLGGDFNQPEKPVNIKLAQDYNYNWLCIRVLEVDIRRTVSRLSDDFSYNGKKADVHFFNKHFELWINYQDRLNILSGLLTIISALLACCAIYGLTVSLVRDKLKQIAVHKLFGARILHVTRLLVMELVKQMILAVVFFGPATYILLNELLRTFAYATKFSWLDPVYPIVYCVLVIVGLCGYQALSLNRRDFASALKAQA